MSPLFGHKDEDQPDAAALQAEIERLDALPLVQLAAEVMANGFGPSGPGEDKEQTVTVGGPNINAGTTVGEIALEFAPGGTTQSADEQLRQRLLRLVAEGVQELEHASLIRAQLHTSMGSLDYALTRRGRSALQQGAVERAISEGASFAQGALAEPTRAH